MSWGLRTIGQGNVDPDAIDLVLFQQMQGLHTLQDVRDAVVQGLRRMLPSMRFNLSRCDMSEDDAERARTIAERISYYEKCVDDLLSGKEVVFVRKHRSTVIPALPHREDSVQQTPHTSISVQQVMPMSAELSTADSSSPSALAMIEHSVEHQKHWAARLWQQGRIALKGRGLWPHRHKQSA